MINYSIRRLAGTLFVFLALSIFTFSLSRAIPGGPWNQGAQIPLSEEQVAIFKAKYGLDKPLVEQYMSWLRNALTLDFGRPFMAPELTVTQLILKQWPYSMAVGGLAASLAVIIGIAMGMVCAARQNSWVDNIVSTYAIISGTVPSFVLGFVLIYFFSARLHWFPAGGWSGLNIKNLLLPVVAFGLPAAGGVARWTRQCVLEAMSADYVRTAYAKGVRQAGVMSRHVLRNALIPMMTSFLPLFPDMMTGSIFIEKTFGIPGLGQYFVNSSFSRDYTLVMGITLFWAVLITVTYLITDILYGIIDPRVRLARRSV